ncbi:MAG: hypothetical protein U0174_13260 [Polyangiaceae bacterium]
MSVLLGAVACGLSASEAGVVSDAGASLDGGDQGAASCPSVDGGVFPDQSPCSAPDGTTCPVANCGGMLAVCRRGLWHFSTLGPQPPACPTEVPSFGDSCSPCWLQSGGFCSYHCGPGEIPVRARCRVLGAVSRTPTWFLEEVPCEGVDAGGKDGAANVDGSAPDANPDL